MFDIVQLAALLADVSLPARVAARAPAAVVTRLLLAPGGARHFDSRTHSHTVRGLLALLPPDDIVALIVQLKALFASTVPDSVSPDDDDVDETDAASSVAVKQQRTIDARRVWVADQLCGLVRHSQVARRADWLADVTAFFFRHAFCERQAVAAPAATTSAKPKKGKAAVVAASAVEVPVPVEWTSISASVRQVCVDRFMSVVAELVTLPVAALADASAGGSSGKKHGPEGVLPDGTLWAARVLDVWQAATASGSGLTLRVALADGEGEGDIDGAWGEEDAQAHHRMCETVVELQAKVFVKPSQKPVLSCRCFACLRIV